MWRRILWRTQALTHTTVDTSLAWRSRSRNFSTIPSSQSSTGYRFGNPILFFGIGASAAFALYHEISTTYNDANETKRPVGGTSDKADVDSVSPPPPRAFQDALRRQNMVAPDWTDYGVYRIDVASLDSNTPIEDDFSYYTASFSPTARYSFFGVFDGHNGGSTARKLAAELSEVVCLHLADLYSKYASDSGEEPLRNPGEPPDPRPPSEGIHTAIKKGFLELDDVMVNESAKRALDLNDEDYKTLNQGKELPESTDKPSSPLSRSQKMKMLAESYAGSCAILGIYDNAERALHVALTGDLRAVLGRRVIAPKQEDQEDGDGSEKNQSKNREPRYMYEVHQLSFDQNASNPKEAERLTALHPNEPELLKNDRVLGWGPSRCFGDGVMKWSLAVQNRLWAEYLGDRPRPETYKTPPYFTAEPEVTTFQKVRRGDFLVLASDGLWDILTNEEVVGLVGKWVEQWGRKERVKVDGEEMEVLVPRKIYPGTTFGFPRKRRDKVDTPGTQMKSEPYASSELPVIYPKGYEDKTAYYRYWRTEKKFTSAAEDEVNVAKHLIRNAVGGADQELSETLYMMEGSRRRRYRDDITIQVIFFE